MTLALKLTFSISIPPENIVFTYTDLSFGIIYPLIRINFYFSRSRSRFSLKFYHIFLLVLSIARIFLDPRFKPIHANVEMKEKNEGESS